MAESKGFRSNRIVVGFVILGLAVIAGCGGGVITPPGSASYSFSILLEKNLDTKTDYLSVEFLRNDSTITGGFVVVDGDTVRLHASGRLDSAFTKKKWLFGHSISIKAIDTSKSFRYQTSVVIPDSFGISNLVPGTRQWQPNKSNPRIEWTGSAGASGYIASLMPRGSGSPAAGQAVVAGSVRAQAFTPTAFNNPQTNQIVPDVYYVHVVAYGPTFVSRPDANYGVPVTAFALTVDTREIAGAVSAAVVSARDSISVSPSL